MWLQTLVKLAKVLAQALVQVKICVQMIGQLVSGALLASSSWPHPAPSAAHSVGLSSLPPTLLSVLEALSASLLYALQLLSPSLLFPVAADTPC